MPSSEFVRADPNLYQSTYTLLRKSGSWPPTAYAGAYAWNALCVWSSPYFYSTMLYLRFDTSALPDDATITGAVLKITPLAGELNNADTRNILVDWHTPALWDPTDPTDWHNPLSGSAASVALSAFTEGVEKQITLAIPTTVSKTGLTNLAVGISGGQPMGVNRLTEDVYTNTKLDVTYTLPGYASKVLGVLAAKVNGVVPAKVIGV